MSNPDSLNQLSIATFEPNQIQLTWFDHRNRGMKGSDLEEIQRMIMAGMQQDPIMIPHNISALNINYAWTQNGFTTPYPFAIPPTNIHPRMSSQISRFTIQGKQEIGMTKMGLGVGILRCYYIADEAIPSLKAELRMLGITHSSLFPELDGLSDELAEIY